jgi:hypothetical protein
MDSKLVEELFNKPDLVAKLLSCSSLDPALLNNLLSNDVKTDLDMFEGVIMSSKPEHLKEVFQFSPETHNLDFAGVANLFEKDKKTDPKLIEKMLENPKLFVDLYTKGNNDANTLKKLVEKGRDFNPELVQKLYGKDKNPFMAANYDFDLTKDKPNVDDHDFHSMTGEGRSRATQEVNNMSRTEGLNFLKPRNFVKINSIVELGSEVNLLEHEDLDEIQQT